MLPVGFEPTISAGERPQTYALDRAAPGTGHIIVIDDSIKWLIAYLKLETNYRILNKNGTGLVDV